VKTLALIQGDLTPGPGGYLLIDGAAKIHQDLSLALLEVYGGDSLHPRWGSILQNLIGGPLTVDMRQSILTEVNRVLSNYITVQNSRIVMDSTAGNISSLTTDDVVGSVLSSSAQQVYDSIIVSVVLETLSRQQIQITQVVS
jgi:phage baseplate assembly protein W